MNSRGADRFGQKTVAVIAVAVLPAARHGNARDVVIAVVSVAGDAPVNVGDLGDVAVRIVFVFCLEWFLEYLHSGIVRFIDIIAVHAVEIDRVVFLRGGDAAGEELPVLAVVICVDILVELPYAVFFKRQRNAIVPYVVRVRVGLVAYRRTYRLYPRSESKYITDLPSGVGYAIDIGLGRHAVAVDAERRYIVRGNYAGNRHGSVAAAVIAPCPAAQAGAEISVGYKIPMADEGQRFAVGGCDAYGVIPCIGYLKPRACDELVRASAAALVLGITTVQRLTFVIVYRGRIAVVVELVCHPAPGVVRNLSIIRRVLKCKRRDICSARGVGQRRNAHGECGCSGVLDVGEGQSVAAAVAAGNILCGSHYMA